MFDVPLPMRRAQRDTPIAGDESPTDGVSTPPNTMAFSLMTKKGNRQQVFFTPTVSNLTIAKICYRHDPLSYRQIRTLRSR